MNVIPTISFFRNRPALSREVHLSLRYASLCVGHKRIPLYLTDSEIISIANKLFGEAKLAFWIIRYTGARRSEIARKNLDDNSRGLKWKDVDWMRNKIKLFSKGKERTVPLHPMLKELLIKEKNRLGLSFDLEDHIIHYVRATLTAYFRRSIKKAGINKPGSVHILRHSAISAILRSSRNIRVAQEYAGHSKITTTELYTHVLQEEMDKAVFEAF